MRAIKGNPHMKARQGALDLNAYLLTNITNKKIAPNSEDMDLLFLNLQRLCKSANSALAIQRTISKNESEVDPVILSDHPQFKPYDQDLKSISILLENELA